MALRLSVFIERCLSLVNLEVNGKSCSSVVYWLSQLHNIVQQNFNSDSALVQILLAAYRNLRWWESLAMVSAENKAKTSFVVLPFRRNSSLSSSSSSSSSSPSSRLCNHHRQLLKIVLVNDLFYYLLPCYETSRWVYNIQTETQQMFS